MSTFKPQEKKKLLENFFGDERVAPIIKRILATQ
jgi:hypothetical protein